MSSGLSGAAAARYIQNGFKEGALSLEHVTKYSQEVEAAGVAKGRIAPMLIPHYTDAHVRDRQLTARYQGTVR